MSDPLVLYESDPPVARLVLNQPAKLNPLSNALRDAFEAGLDRADADPAIRVVIVKGAGRAFSAGYDLTPGPEPDFGGPDAEIHEQIAHLKRSGLRWIRAVWEFRKPVIAQVHGYCMAGANDLAGVCDLTFASDDCIFSVNESRVLGTNHMLGLWPLLIGMKKTKELFLTGGYVTGSEAADLGMINGAFPYDDLDREVDAIARRVAIGPTELLQSIKVGVNRWFEIMGLDTMVRSTAEWDGLASKNSKMAEWARLVVSEGVPAALDWRDGPYGDRPFPYRPRGPENE